MRDPTRIKKFCDDLTVLWKRYVPDWRFGQFITNVFSWIYKKTGRDPFYIEENEMIELIRDYFEGDKK